jgi:hypothetical protein
MLQALHFLLLFAIVAFGGSDPIYIKVADDVFPQIYASKDCLNSVDLGEAAENRKCGRAVVDGLFSNLDISKLRGTVEKGLSQREAIGGPCILDLNTGYG